MSSMKILVAIIVILSFVSSCSSKKVVYQCKASREYITALKYLRAHQEFAVKDGQARKIADEVSTHCTGASARFVRVTNLLSQAGLASSDSIEMGKRFAGASEETTLAFIDIFRESFLKKYLDLSLADSLETARSLSIDFKGSAKRVVRDFHHLVRFCLSGDSLDLPKAECAKIAAEITGYGANFKNDIAPPFVKLYTFLTASGRGPKQPLFEALNITRAVMKNGPFSAENFMVGYKYAVSRKGLALSKGAAINFAKQMANRTLKPQAK